jgi:hypothetical protein
MTLGLAERQGDLLDDLNRFCEQAIAETSVYALLNRERDRLFPDEMFADLFSDRGRRSVPPCVVATVMVLQRLEGLSDREAVDRYAFDARWRYAAGVGGYDGDGWAQFAHTVLVDMRARLAASKDPRRVFRVALDAASRQGWSVRSGCWIPRRSTTRSPRWTPSRCSARRSAACSRPPVWSLPPSSRPC